MKQINILFTSVGRRVELVQAFKDAGLRTNMQVKLYGVDLSAKAPALFFCDERRKICRIDDDNYIPRLLELCSSEKIDILIPTIDTDLLLLAESKTQFERNGTRVLISDPDKIRVCRDKRETADFFISCGLLSPIPVDCAADYHLDCPCFIKPLNGSSSIDAFKVENQEELFYYTHKVNNYIIQPYIEGVEYTVDIFCDFEGNPIYITPRERILVRGGEVLQTKIVEDKVIVTECEKLIQRFRPCGPLTVQLIRQKGTDDDYYIEINPRFGGGAPLSMKAGANSAKVILELLSNTISGIIPDLAQAGTIYSRFDQSICVSGDSFHNKHRGISKIDAIIFDLDDTLYAEKDYVRSGLRAVSQVVPQIERAFEKLWIAFEQGLSPIDEVLKKEGMESEELTRLCLHTYRFHKPNIQLYSGVEELLREIKASGKYIGIITDGRVEGQKEKIKALGLELLVDEIIITDEIGGEQFRKPNDIAFRIMREKLSTTFENMVYVGDNPKKDFIAPKNLNMKWIYFHNKEGLYSKYSYQESGVIANNIQEIRSLIEDAIRDI